MVVKFIGLSKANKIQIVLVAPNLRNLAVLVLRDKLGDFMGYISLFVGALGFNCRSLQVHI